jgi:hypothetical protein
MDPMNPDIKSGCFSGFPNGNLNFLGNLFDHLFNTGRMNTAITDQPLQGKPGDFPSN